MTDIHSQQQQQLQENNNSSSRDAKKPQEGLGPDEMWAPGALGHHRELPVDVPDTLLQKAYPNKVKNRSSDYRNGLQHRPRSASDLDLSLNLKNETLKTRTTPADGRVRLVSNDDVDSASRTINVRNGLQPLPMLKIELKIEDEEEKKVKVAKKNPASIDKYRDSPIAIDSPDLKSDLKALGEYENVEDASEQKESGVDVEDDYPFAKEDYPTMLKTCSDDSASPRSSSGRSDSTAPLDTSLRCEQRQSKNKDKHKDVRHTLYDVRRIDLGSPCRSVMPDIKIAPLFGRARDTTSFDNPAYGLTDLQELQGLLRSDEASDMTRLIDDQCSSVPRIPKEQDKAPPVRAEDQQIESSRTTTEHSTSKSGAKNTKRRGNVDERAKLKAKSRSLDIEELIRTGSTDDLLGIELSHLSSLSSSSARPKKKHRHQQISSGYSTLRSEVSGDLERSSVDRSFLVVSNRSYREVAVDCPPDFVPVTKRHPVYPPPNKITTPGNSKHNTLEPKRDRVSEGGACTPATTTMTTTITTTITTTALVASPCLPPNDNSRYTTLSSGDDGSARETIVARNATVDRKHDARKVRSRVKSLIVDGLHSIMHNEHCKSLRCASLSTHHLNAPTRLRSNEPVLQSFNMNSGEFSVSACSLAPKKLFYENPCFDVSHDENVHSDVFPRRKFLENVKHPFSSSSFRDECPKDWQNSFHAEGKDGGTIFSSFSTTIDDHTRPADLSLSEDNVVNSSECLLADFENEIREITPSDWPEKITTREQNPSLPDVSFLKLADTPTQLSFIQETNQNSRNSLHELSPARRHVVRHIFVNDVSDDLQRSQKEELHNRCDSPNTQNQKNSSLSVEYKSSSKMLNVPIDNGAKFRVCRRSMSDISDLTAIRIRFLLSLRDPVPNPKISRRIVGQDGRDQPMMTLHDSDGCTKRSSPRPSNERTLKSYTRESAHVDSLEQVNRNGLCDSILTIFVCRVV